MRTLRSGIIQFVSDFVHGRGERRNEFNIVVEVWEFEG